MQTRDDDINVVNQVVSNDNVGNNFHELHKKAILKVRAATRQ